MRPLTRALPHTLARLDRNDIDINDLDLESCFHSLADLDLVGLRIHEEGYLSRAFTRMVAFSVMTGRRRILV